MGEIEDWERRGLEGLKILPACKCSTEAGEGTKDKVLVRSLHSGLNGRGNDLPVHLRKARGDESGR